MDLVYRNRDPLAPELEEFVVGVASDLDLDAESVIVYPGSNGGGVYIGREEDSPVIGIELDNMHILAHELAHDFYAQEVEGEFWNADPVLTESGAIKASPNMNDSLEILANEIFADNVAREYVESDQMFDRNPLGYVKGHLETFGKFSGPDREHISSMIDYGHNDRPYFDETTSIEEYEKLEREIRDLWESDQETLSELLYNSWSENIRRCYIQDHEDIVWSSVEEFNDSDYSGVVWHQIEKEYGDHVQDLIEKNFDYVVMEIMKKIQHRKFLEKLESGELFRPEFDNVPTPSPSHFSTLVGCGNLDHMNTDYDHEVGNFVGSHLYDLGVTFRELKKDKDKLESLAQNALDLAIEMGAHPENYDNDDFKDGIKFLAQDLDFLEE